MPRPPCHMHHHAPHRRLRLPFRPLAPRVPFPRHRRVRHQPQPGPVRRHRRRPRPRPVPTPHQAHDPRLHRYAAVPLPAMQHFLHPNHSAPASATPRVINTPTRSLVGARARVTRAHVMIPVPLLRNFWSYISFIGILFLNPPHPSLLRHRPSRRRYASKQACGVLCRVLVTVVTTAPQPPRFTYGMSLLLSEPDILLLPCPSLAPSVCTLYRPAPRIRHLPPPSSSSPRPAPPQPRPPHPRAFSIIAAPQSRAGSPYPRAPCAPSALLRGCRPRGS